MTNKITVTEAANQLGVSPATIRRWCNKGKLQVVRNPMNNYRLINQEDINRLKLILDKVE